MSDLEAVPTTENEAADDARFAPGLSAEQIWAVDRAALQALCDKTTPSPWTTRTRGAYTDLLTADKDRAWIGEARNRADAEFMSAARSAIPILLAREKSLLAEFGSVRSSLEQNSPTKENEMAVKLSSQASRDAHVASLKAPPTAPPVVVCQDDVCECGDYRKQHEFSGSCAVCRDVPAPWNGCKRFRFASRSHDHDGARCLPTPSAAAYQSPVVAEFGSGPQPKELDNERELGADDTLRAQISALSEKWTAIAGDRVVAGGQPARARRAVYLRCAGDLDDLLGLAPSGEVAP